MAEADVDRPSDPTPAITAPGRARPTWRKALVGLAMLALLAFISGTVRSLLAEWRSLQGEQRDERLSAAIGYVNITPNPSYATTPANWFHDEGDQSLLWAGWKDGENRWFRFAKGDLEVRQLSLPIGRDAIQAIDRPVYEKAGDSRWDRIPPEALVVGFEQGGAAIAYPVQVLNKVEVINDVFGGRPLLVS